jgi:hypothetical protein
MPTLETLFVDNLWVCLLTWLVLYISDYYLTIWGAHLYRSGAQEHIVYEGSYELTPQFQKDIDALKLFSLNFW